MGAAIGGAIAGSMGTKDFQIGVDKFSSALVTSGQILTVFQGKMGKAAAAGIQTLGLVQGIDAFVKGLGKAEMAYNMTVERSQKTAASLEALSTSIGKLDSMYNNSSVSLENINKEFRTFEENLAKLSASGPEGAKAAIAIQTAGSPEAQQLAIRNAGIPLNKQVEKDANSLALKKQKGERSALIFGTSLSGGAFGFNSDAEKENVKSLLQSLSSSIISGLSDKQKTGLIKDINDPEKFLQRLSGSKEFQTYTEDLNEKDKNKVVKQTRIGLTESRVNSDPQMIAILKSAQQQNASTQAIKNALISNETNLKQLFLNQGSVGGAAALSLRNFRDKEPMNAGAIELSRRKAEQENSFNDFQGPKTRLLRNQAIEADTIGHQFEEEVQNLRSKGAGEINKLLSLAASSLYKSGQGGVGMGGGTSNISDQNLKVIGAINKGITAVAGRGELTDFIKAGGGINPANSKKLEESITKASGIENDKNFNEFDKELFNKTLENLRSDPESLKLLAEINDSTKDAADKAQQQLKTLETNSREQIKGIDKLTSASAFGGTGALERGSQRQLRRQFATGIRLAEQGKDPISQGRGALQAIKAFPGLGLRFDSTNPAHASLERKAVIGLEAQRKQN